MSHQPSLAQLRLVHRWGSQGHPSIGASTSPLGEVARIDNQDTFYNL